MAHPGASGASELRPRPSGLASARAKSTARSVFVRSRVVNKPHRLLAFRCTGCGNCCKDPLLPLTDADVKRISQRTGESAEEFVRWVDKNGIEMDDEPEGFVSLRQGKRVMVLRHGRRGCRYLGEDNRCTIYTSRPLGCRIFPFDPVFKKDGKLRHLTLIQATDCKYELDGKNDVNEMRKLNDRYEAATEAYQDKIADWNKKQRSRKLSGRAPESARRFLEYLGLD
jgi:Fe-S-cluster containining protein